MQMSGQVHAPAALFLEKEPLVPSGQEGGWVDLRVGMNAVKKDKTLKDQVHSNLRSSDDGA
jgi:hypothetical protein